ncbi:alpha-L-Rha alpha-1,3-L-rhamnosyltransferase [Pseudoalteromonas sp. SW0106-04]|uniref:glycosyltransferase family 2 protein n=1 Tax=Pseudoalteromonas sp. SW0106-04 TaxID=1702169 RepID=UPI0006B67FEA|nr:glycosyltransferase family 2 protein [Pseudoalteromonas sp. SW0106-04]GAP74583.1 alpha-L-Rha alpha-1,3-L-rhamnosyltransferase [Pseudoalteromonas sp. SW0106-04]
MGRVCVLLATYNGSCYIEEQLKSLFEQSCRPQKIIISDDNSTDNTWSIIEQWQKRYPSIVELHRNTTTRHGHVGNFTYLCELGKKTTCKYFLFCDQDDVWLDTKIETLVEECKRQEGEDVGLEPVLVHSDLEVVDSNLKEIAPSFFEYQGLPHASELSFPKLFIQNNVTGCASLVNRCLLELATPLPDQVLVHDWWFTQVAHALGKVSFINNTLVKYRQHGGNAIGASAKQQIKFMSPQHIRLLINAAKHLKSSYLQAQALSSKLEKQAPGLAKQQRYSFAYLDKLTIKQRWSLAKELVNNRRCLFEKTLMNLAMIWLIIFHSK